MQSRKMSVLETVVSTLAGFIISWLLLWFLADAFNWQNNASRNTLVTIIFTAASLLRGYVIRRLFNRVPTREEAKSAAKIPDMSAVQVFGDKWADEDQQHFINETLARNAPVPFPTGEQTPGK